MLHGVTLDLRISIARVCRGPSLLRLRGIRWWLRSYLSLILLLMYAPILTLIAFSFNDSRRNIVWKGFTLKYYGVAWNNSSLVEAFTNSIVIAVMCTVMATILGTLVAVLLWRFHFPAKPLFEGFVGLPIVVPAMRRQ